MVCAKILGQDGIINRRNQYLAKVFNTAPSNLLALWPLNEASGSTAFDISGNGRNGAYVNSPTFGQTGIGDGGTSVLLTAASSQKVNVFTTSFANAFNGGEFTIAIWFKVSGAGVWSDGVTRHLLRMSADGNNVIRINRQASNNNIIWAYTAGGTTKTVAAAVGPGTGWLLAAMTVTKSGDAMKAYIGSTQQGATQTGLGTWAGTFNSGDCTLGSQQSTFYWDGYLAYGGVWSTALSNTQISALATIP